MKILRNTVFAVMALAVSAFAQLPSTCIYTAGSNPKPITVTRSGNLYFGFCIDGVVYQVPTVAVSPAIDSLTILNIPPLFPEAMSGKSLRKYCHAQYSRAVDGGAISTITPVNGCVLPANAIVTNALIYVPAACTGASGTLSIGWGVGGNVASLLSAAGVSGLTTGSFQQSLIVPQTASTFLHLAADTAITFTIATTAFTAGIVDVWVEYVVSPL